MTTDITELAQSLKAAANITADAIDRLKAFPGDELIDLSQHEGEQVDIDIATLNQWYELSSPANIRALVESLEKAQATEAHCNRGWREAHEQEARAEAVEKRIAELESQVKFPGVMRCNTCGFSRSHVIVTPGGMLAGESEPEHCPNGCGPLWHETYRRQYNELYNAYKELESRTVKLPEPEQWDITQVLLCKKKVVAAIRAAGIKVEAE
ncbi:hypothetical protein HPB55_22175 [Klebsiella michiganensis]|uniref:hypothetical protein n=1 Tax=Klebsiella michiganensis TaxID=1134687 RepID=UPI001B3A6CCF|nr:hypothetical protein [Klebsiella michiganensis]MBQ4656795.1 hypothetical protein [Klebsiella michiganensis]MBQ4659260.1 hypothetical protein [Klebsiella michiganensis]